MMKKLAFIIALTVATSLPLSSAYAGGQLSQPIAVKVQRANNLQLDNKVDQAIALLVSLKPTQAYDKAFVQRMLGVFYWQQGNSAKAISNLTQAVKSGLLQDDQAWVTERMLADILLSEQKYSQALPHYYQLTKRIPKNQKGYELWLRIAQSHYQLSQWSKVLTAMKRYDGYNRKDEMSPLSIKLGAQLQLKQWSGATSTLNRLIALEPTKLNWWQQLANIQIRAGKPNDALSTLKLAKYQGVALTQQDLHRLAQLYAQRGIPERAAKQIAELDGADSNTQLLVEQANYWQMAREWQSAINVWRKAAQRNNKYRWQLAQLLLQEGHYQKALTELNKVKRKDKQADVELAKVRAYYKLNDFDNAIIHAKQANNIKASAAASSWVKYLSQMREMEETS